MKKAILYILFVCLFVYPTFATYYEITTDIYTPGLTLQTGDSLYMTDGGFGSLNLHGDLTATIEGTAALVEGSGGIWNLNSAWNSHLDMSGGQVHQLTMNNTATATLTGGLIEAIYSYQIVTNPHITLYYSGNLPAVQKIGGFNYLVGNWGDGTDFNIYLHNTGYNTYGNFEFILIPEPATLLLLSLGGLLIRRKK
jgi:hypothetical protein